MQEIRRDIQQNMENKIPQLKIAIDTGKAFTKSCYKGTGGAIVCDKFASAMGIIPEDSIQSRNNHMFYCEALRGYFYIEDPELCDITPTSDNEKNGSGLSTGESNHDREIAVLGICLSIMKAMKNLGIYQANVDLAIGAPLSEYEKVITDEEGYFKSLLPVRRAIKCRYEGVVRMFTITSFGVYPETLSSFSLNKGEELGNMILVDIGGNNIQYICATNGQINFDREKTFTSKGGVNNLARRIRTLMIQDQIEPVGSIVEINGWLSDPKTIPTGYGSTWKQRFKDLIESEKKCYFKEISSIFDPVRGNYREEIQRGYRICYTGGGSVLLKNEIKAGGGKVLDNGEYANVMGFYGLFR